MDPASWRLSHRLHAGVRYRRDARDRRRRDRHLGRWRLTFPGHRGIDRHCGDAGVLVLELGLPPRDYRLDRRQVGAEVHGAQRTHRGAHRRRIVDRALFRPLSGRGHLRHRLPAAVVHGQAPDDRRHGHEHGLRARRTPTGAAQPHCPTETADGAWRRGAGDRGRAHRAGMFERHKPLDLHGRRPVSALRKPSVGGLDLISRLENLRSICSGGAGNAVVDHRDSDRAAVLPGDVCACPGYGHRRNDGLLARSL